MSLKNFTKKISKSFYGGRPLFLASIVWISIILSAWDVQQVYFLGEYFDKLLFGDYWVLSNHASWMTLAGEISQGNLLPVYSLSGQVETDLKFYPYLSLWISGLLVYMFGVSSAVLIGGAFFSIASYIFMVLIYKNYLPWRWSISLSALGVLSFSLAPFRDFLAGLVIGKGWLELGTSQSPDILNFPFPSIALSLFLFVFFLSIKKTHMSRRRITLLSILWAAQSQVHIVSAIIGIPFWLGFLALTFWRSNRNHWSLDQTKQLLAQVAIVAIVCIPMLTSVWLQLSSIEGLSPLVGEVRDINWMFIVGYFVAPLLTLKLAYWVFRIDPYELIFKFLPVWIMMFVELALMLMWWVFGIGIPSELLINRLGMFFLHIFYFTPSIYCMHRSTLSYHHGTESLAVSRKLRSILSWIFKNASSVYLPLFVILLTIFALSSSEKSFQYFQKNIVPAHEEAKKISKLLTFEAKQGDLLIGPNNMTNISLILDNRYRSLWTNKVISEVDVDTAIERFALYAQVIGWTESQYLLFMLPTKSLFQYSSDKIEISKSGTVPGLGYWLTMHNKPMNDAEKNTFLLRLREVYRSIQVKEKLKEYEVRRIVVHKNSKYAKEAKGRVVGEYKIINF